MDNWVFVPGYYQGKAPWGIYVGKTAWTHYDFSAFNDYDRDAAFVTVYNGLHIRGGKATQVTAKEFAPHNGVKYIDEKPITAEEYTAGVEKYGADGPFKSKVVDPKIETVAKPAGVDSVESVAPYLTAEGKDGVKLVGAEVTKSVYDAAPDNYDNNAKFIGLSKVIPISLEEYNELKAAKADGKFLGELLEVKNGNQVVGWTKQQFFLKKWIKATAQVKYWVETYFVVEDFIKDAGRLGDNVGGQGFTWNQKPQQTVFVFGYPDAPHPDGNDVYTGVTPKWTYGKTSGKVYVS
ncbi:hypothetical protein, partial [Micromonospora harpali]